MAAVPEQIYKFLNPHQVAVVPNSVVRDLGGSLSSLALRPADLRQIIPIAQDLARRSAFTIYASDGNQVRSFNSVQSIRPKNMGEVAVPIALAILIVLNTMLGAVAERTREIHVYISLGLAPRHVGTLFLAEAAALGTIGVVFGYVFGQGLATLLSHTHLMAGVDLNFSSMSAIYTMGLVLGIVMLSTLWPAWTAMRVAAPSSQRDWKLPAAQGDLLQVDLPFTVNALASRGICAFLAEYFVSISQAGSGRFSAEAIEPFASIGHRGITCRVWLAPYDLGVIQTFWLAIHPTTDPNVYEVKLSMIREAGNPATWYRLNRPFLVEVRKQFLLWRALTPNLMHDYLVKSDEMFAQSPSVLGTAVTADK